MTRKALSQILRDVQPIVEKLRGVSGSRETLAVIPWPDFFDKEYLLPPCRVPAGETRVLRHFQERMPHLASVFQQGWKSANTVASAS
jgi:hypothetical protein